MWSDVLVFARFFSKEDYILINDIKFNKTAIYGIFSLEKNISAYDYIKQLPYDERDIIIKSLDEKYEISSKILNQPNEYWKLMNKDQIKKLSESELVTIGSHGYKHFNLGNLSLSDAEIELNHSKQLLENTIGKKVTMIAYPDGSYNDDIKNLAEKCGYKHQLAVDYSCPSDKKDFRILGRYGLSSTTTFDSNIINLSMAFKTKGF
jgi:peptidoglycan/xylan/chitin deacetylase (PgdA/CDA1 family)